MDIGGEQALKDYIRASGGVGLMLALKDEEGKIVRKITSELEVAGPTVTDRLEDARKLELIERTLSTEDHGNAHRYQLTSRGSALKDELEECGLADKYRKYINAKHEYHESRSRVSEQLKDSEFMHPNWPPEPDKDDPRPR